jgi:hypothetical protein
MPSFVALVVLLAAALFIGWRIGKERELFVLHVAGGKITSAHGRVPPGLLGDLREVLAGSGASGTVTALRSEGRACLRLRGSFPPPLDQRLRNVLGTVSLARLLATPKR